MGQNDFVRDKEKVSDLYHNQDYNAALSLANELLSQKTDYDLLITKSYIEEYLDLEKAAIQSLTDAIFISDEDHALFFRRGALEYRQGWYDQCIADLNQYISNPPESTTAILYQLDLAGTDQMKIKTSNSLLAEAYSIRGLAHQHNRNYDLAQSDFENAINTEPDVAYLLNLGLLVAELGDTIQAVDYLKAGLRIEPDHAMTWYNLLLIDRSVVVPDSIYKQNDFYPMVVYRGIDAIQDGDYSLASQLIEPLLLQPSSKPEVFMYAGRISYGIGDYKNAILRYHEALSRGFKEAEIHLLLANSYFQAHIFDAATSEYEIYLIAQSTDASAWFNAAVAYHRLGDSSNMCRCLGRSIGLGMSNNQIIRMQKFCN
jgi:tetratricopeptide (TPR) repeat protein